MNDATISPLVVSDADPPDPPSASPVVSIDHTLAYSVAAFASTTTINPLTHRPNRAARVEWRKTGWEHPSFAAALSTTSADALAMLASKHSHASKPLILLDVERRIAEAEVGIKCSDATHFLPHTRCLGFRMKHHHPQRLRRPP